MITEEKEWESWVDWGISAAIFKEEPNLEDLMRSEYEVRFPYSIPELSEEDFESGEQEKRVMVKLEEEVEEVKLEEGIKLEERVKLEEGVTKSDRHNVQKHLLTTLKSMVFMVDMKIEEESHSTF